MAPKFGAGAYVPARDVNVSSQTVGLRTNASGAMRIEDPPRKMAVSTAPMSPMS